MMSTAAVKYDKLLFESIKSKELLKVVDALTESGYQVRLVGGVVRDILIGKSGTDIDLATDATPWEMARVFFNAKLRYIETGLQHGTLTVHVNQKNFEVTTLRSDVATYGRHAEVNFVRDWKVDAERRDLTINAMSMDVYTGQVYDYFDGYRDLLERKVQFVGDPRKRIQEDYLRILRYYRFLGKISIPYKMSQFEKDFRARPNDPDFWLLRVIREEARGLFQISAERIWSEFKKIIVGPNARSMLQLMRLTDVLKYSRLKDVFSSHIDRFGVVSENAARVINELNQNSQNNVTLNPTTALASIIDNVRQIEIMSKSLKFSKNETLELKFIVSSRSHYNPSKPNEIPFKKYKDIILYSYKACDFDALRSLILQLILYEGNCDHYRFFLEWNPPVFPVTGNHLKEKNLRGTEIGYTMSKLKKLWVESNCSLTLEELLSKI